MEGCGISARSACEDGDVMDPEAVLQALLTSYWQLQDGPLNWETRFNSRGVNAYSSLRMLRLLASVEDRFGITIEDPDAIRTFGDLLAVVTERRPLDSPAKAGSLGIPPLRGST